MTNAATMLPVAGVLENGLTARSEVAVLPREQIKSTLLMVVGYVDHKVHSPYGQAVIIQKYISNSNAAPRPIALR